MSIGLLLGMLAPHLLAAEVAHAHAPVRIELSPAEFARERTALAQPAPLRVKAAADRFPLLDDATYETPLPDLALKAGSRRGTEVELGALGGGRADAPSLVHVGVGFDF
ncbi:hypothetical protein H7F51_01330 [Novosphingobium flavum]|uniref:Uncharacterized protein n=1 Tax=Novosphingobium flavum TaxID=1778672 RepID=A0A7X1KKD0_9SPHN|nr:hypothetical protein [Novosphingobium flavum]MBC2664153.1 hypothetical protein [Novosphingobium flavum]